MTKILHRSSKLKKSICLKRLADMEVVLAGRFLSVGNRAETPIYHARAALLVLVDERLQLLLDAVLRETPGEFYPANRRRMGKSHAHLLDKVCGWKQKFPTLLGGK